MHKRKPTHIGDINLCWVLPANLSSVTPMAEPKVKGQSRTFYRTQNMRQSWALSQCSGKVRLSYDRIKNAPMSAKHQDNVPRHSVEIGYPLFHQPYFSTLESCFFFPQSVSLFEYILIVLMMLFILSTSTVKYPTCK